jgi:hypothetical protein
MKPEWIVAECELTNELLKKVYGGPRRRWI